MKGHFKMLSAQCHEGFFIDFDRVLQMENVS